MTWLTLTAEVHNAQTKQVMSVKRRINFDLVAAYEPNAAGGTSLVVLGSVQQVDEPVGQIDAALINENHELRTGWKNPAWRLSPEKTKSEMNTTVNREMGLPPVGGPTLMERFISGLPGGALFK